MPRISTSELTNKIYTFCEAYSGVTLFPYQQQFAKRIIRSVLDGDGDEITALFSRQSGKSETVSTICGGLAIILPILANMPMFINDPRLKMFKNGFMIGIFAPTLNQAQIVFGRMKKRMGSKRASEVLSDPEINLSFDVANGQNVILSNNSLISCKSASEGSNIEGDSYMLIIVDEAQDVGNFKYSKSISPMGAFYNATKILIGTATTRKGFFYDSIDRNKKEYASGGRRNHFEYDWRTVAKYNPNYLKYIEGEKKRLGEDSDEFQMSYCLKWILSRGMFITSTLFDKLALPELGLVPSDLTKSHIAGIDLGKKMDSTVITILEVDWDNPVVVEESKEFGIPAYTGYNVTVKYWKEFAGDDWDAQYNQIIDVLNQFKLAKIVIDATGVGDAIYDRMRVNYSCDVIPFVFSKPAKSDLYKRLNSEIRAGRVHYPANDETKETREFKKFEQQFLDLEKDYSGQLMVVAHPDVAGAHDDYPDSLALAVWGANDVPLADPVTETNPRTLNRDLKRTNRRNNITARRRR